MVFYFPPAIGRLQRFLPARSRKRVQSLVRATRDGYARTMLAADAMLMRAAPVAMQQPPAVPVFWTPSNLGDDLNGEMLGKMLKMRPFRVAPHYSPKILAIGSTLQYLLPGDRVIGTGLIRDQTVDARGATIYAVRGPLTMARLRDCDPSHVYGDLALLLPTIYNPLPVAGIEVVIVPHYVDKHAMAIHDSRVSVVDVESRDVRRQIDTIASAEIVVSSSLHGIIIAEAYGVPAVWVEASKNVIGDGFKFRDHYAATDRHIVPQQWDQDLSFLSQSDSTITTIPTENLQAALARLRADILNHYGLPAGSLGAEKCE